MCRELEVPSKHDKSFEIWFCWVMGGQNWRENKARSPQALETAQSHLGLGLRAVEPSKHERHGFTLAFQRGHSGSWERVGFEWVGLKTGRPDKNGRIVAGGEKKEMHGLEEECTWLVALQEMGRNKGETAVGKQEIAESESSALDKLSLKWPRDSMTGLGCWPTPGSTPPFILVTEATLF